MKKRAMLATAALGAAYLMRNEKSRNKIKEQFKELSSKKS